MRASGCEAWALAPHWTKCYHLRVVPDSTLVCPGRVSILGYHNYGGGGDHAAPVPNFLPRGWFEEVKA